MEFLDDNYFQNAGVAILLFLAGLAAMFVMMIIAAVFMGRVGLRRIAGYQRAAAAAPMGSAPHFIQAPQGPQTLPGLFTLLVVVGFGAFGGACVGAIGALILAFTGILAEDLLAGIRGLGFFGAFVGAVVGLIIFVANARRATG